MNSGWNSFLHPRTCIDFLVETARLQNLFFRTVLELEKTIRQVTKVTDKSRGVSNLDFWRRMLSDIPFPSHRWYISVSVLFWGHVFAHGIVSNVSKYREYDTKYCPMAMILKTNIFMYVWRPSAREGNSKLPKVISAPHHCTQSAFEIYQKFWFRTRGIELEGYNSLNVTLRERKSIIKQGLQRECVCVLKNVLFCS